MVYQIELCVRPKSSATKRIASKRLKKVKIEEQIDQITLIAADKIAKTEKLRRKIICLRIEEIIIRAPTAIIGEISKGEFLKGLKLRKRFSHGSHMRARSFPNGL